MRRAKLASLGNPLELEVCTGSPERVIVRFLAKDLLVAAGRLEGELKAWRLTQDRGSLEARAIPVQPSPVRKDQEIRSVLPFPLPNEGFYLACKFEVYEFRSNAARSEEGRSLQGRTVGPTKDRRPDAFSVLYDERHSELLVGSWRGRIRRFAGDDSPRELPPLEVPAKQGSEEPEKKPITALAVSHAGDLLLAAVGYPYGRDEGREDMGNSYGVYRWNYRDGDWHAGGFVLEPNSDSNGYEAARFLPNRPHLLLATRSGRLRLLDAKGGRTIGTWDHPYLGEGYTRGRGFLDLAIDPSERFALVASCETNWKKRDRGSFLLVADLTEHGRWLDPLLQDTERSLTSARVSPDGRLLAVGLAASRWKPKTSPGPGGWVRVYRLDRD
ncbi:MAG: hypothetical protein D6731_17200 [Planctomycetota bacterium]|nr:MAG: hypothetical protein D6731_17200 [Planctomycetota bacterium]